MDFCKHEWNRKYLYTSHWSCMYFLSQHWHVLFLAMWTYWLFFVFTHCIYYAFCIYYMNFWHVLYPLGYCPMYLDWMNKKVSKYKAQKSNLSFPCHTHMSAKLCGNEMKFTFLSRICDIPACWEVPTRLCSSLQLGIEVLPLSFCPEHLGILIVLPVNIYLYYAAVWSKSIKSSFELLNVKTKTKSSVMSVSQQTDVL
jgi:hypothetical protein